MDKDVKQQWLTALRSGEYRQCIGELKNPGGQHCCLGVLLQSQGWKTTPYHKDNADYTYYMSPQGDINNEECELSENTRSEFGLTRQQEVHLIKLNDDKGWSFKMISKWIEDHL